MPEMLPAGRVECRVLRPNAGMLQMHTKLALLAVTGLVAVAAAPAMAQTVAKKPPEAKAAAADKGLKAYDAGARAFQEKKYDRAISSLTEALTLGGLSSQQIAKALYYRGAAYRHQGKAGQAISDLTSAVWLKGGLADSERSAAMEERAQAYREAGLGEPLPIGTPPLDQAPSVPAATAAATATASEAVTSSWAPATSAKAATEASTPALAAGPVGSGATSPSAPTLSALPAGDATEATSSAPSLTGVGTTIGGAGSAIGGFFQNLFSGGSSGQQATSASSTAVETASTGPAGGEASNADWGAATSVAAGAWATTATEAGSAKAAKTAKAAAGSQPSAQQGIGLQLTAVRSREEAEHMAKAVTTALPNTVGAVSPTIDEVVYGNMGKFYRVRLGPYASVADAEGRCSDLKPHGYDCVVVKP